MSQINKKYLDIIKEIYKGCSITYDISYYGNIGDGTDQSLIKEATHRMNVEILNNFISQVGLYIKNIKENIVKLSPVFANNFSYNEYQFIPVRNA
jgi:hypothetical protein